MANTVLESGAYTQLSATANVSSNPARLMGVFCSSSSAGTLTVYDSATNTTINKIVDTFNLTASNFYRLPFQARAGLYVVIGGTASITLSYLPGAG
ncbi:MAG: hypothetical protein ACRD52_00745 [Candidatus Acidiferrales bacterium]